MQLPQGSCLLRELSSRQLRGHTPDIGFSSNPILMSNEESPTNSCVAFDCRASWNGEDTIVRTMAERGMIEKRLVWVFVAWSLLVVGWAIVGHPGVKGFGGEGRILVLITNVVIWSIGDVALAVAWWVVHHRHKSET